MKHSTVWAVWTFIVFYAALLVLTLVVDFVMPLDGATYALFLVVGGYVGMDEFASFVASKKMPKGMRYTGSITKLRNIVIAMFAIVILALVVQALSPTVALPLDQIVLAAGLVAGLFAGGNKAAVAAEQEGPTQ